MLTDSSGGASFPYMGETFALLSPLAWSFAVVLFRKTGERVSPVALNLFKTIVSALLFGLVLLGVMLVTGSGGALPDVSGRDYALLLVSGFVGVGIADLLFFMCVNRLGAGRQAIINTAYSPPIILLSWLLLGERLSAMQLVGVGAILMAVLIVGMTRQADGERDPRLLLLGILYGVGACFSQAVSIVMVKPFMDEWPLVWTTAWRMYGGVIGALFIYAIAKPADRQLAPLWQSATLKVMLPATFLGSFVALILWMAGFKYADASVAAALNQTATLFTFVLAVVILKEPVTPRRIAGLACGIVGVVLVTFFKGASEGALG